MPNSVDHPPPLQPGRHRVHRRIESVSDTGGTTRVSEREHDQVSVEKQPQGDSCGGFGEGELVFGSVEGRRVMNEETTEQMTDDYRVANDYRGSCAMPRLVLPEFERLDSFAVGLNVADQNASDLVRSMAHGLRQRIWDSEDESCRLRDQIQKTESLRVDAMQKAQTVLEEGTSIWNAVLRVAELLKVEAPMNEVWDQSLLDNHIQQAILELQKNAS